jgi:hypothetical protein
VCSNACTNVVRKEENVAVKYLTDALGNDAVDIDVDASSNSLSSSAENTWSHKLFVRYKKVIKKIAYIRSRNHILIHLVDMRRRFTHSLESFFMELCHQSRTQSPLGS